MCLTLVLCRSVAFPHITCELAQRRLGGLRGRLVRLATASKESVVPVSWSTPPSRPAREWMHRLWGVVQNLGCYL